MNKTKKITPYKSVGFKSKGIKLTIIIVGISFLFLLNYTLFVQRNIAFLVGTAILGFFLYQLITKTKNILYEFNSDGVIIHYGKRKKYAIKKEEIGRVRKVLKSSDFIGIRTGHNVITREAYFTTSKKNMICFYLRDKRNVIISPRVLKPRVLNYYDSDRLIDRF